MTSAELKAAIRAFIYDKDAYTSNGAANVVHAMDLLIDELDGGGGSGGGATPGIDDVLVEAQDLTEVRTVNLGGHSLRFLNGHLGISNTVPPPGLFPEFLFHVYNNNLGSDLIFIDDILFKSSFQATDGTAVTGIVTNADLAGNTVNFSIATLDGTNPMVIIVGDLIANSITHTAGTHIFNGNMLLLTTDVPGAANATGSTGQFAWDANFIYMCIAPDTWKRVAIATW